MYHDGTSHGLIILNMGENTVVFKHFYFYKNHIIAHSDLEYFIINEKKQTIEEYKDKIAWESELKKRNLTPFLLREYDCNYSSAFGNSSTLFFIFFPFPFFLPLLWIICFISLFFSNKKFYIFRKYFVWMYPGFLILIMIFDLYPQSI